MLAWADGRRGGNGLKLRHGLRRGPMQRRRTGGDSRFNVKEAATLV